MENKNKKPNKYFRRHKQAGNVGEWFTVQPTQKLAFFGKKESIQSLES